MAWSVSRHFDKHTESTDLEINGSVAVVPATAGDSPCYRSDPEAPVRSLPGYWRGSVEPTEGPGDGILLEVASPGTLTEAWADIEFFDGEIGWVAVQHRVQDVEGIVHHVCTSIDDEKWESTWVNSAGTGTWQRAVIRLVNPVFGGGEGDVRVVGNGPVFLRSLTISADKPADADQYDQLAHADRIYRELEPRFARPSVPSSVGNIGAIFGKSDISSAQKVAPWLPVYKALGFNAIQSYVVWARIEREEGVWDWSFYDWVVEQAKRFDMKWVAFIMIGPHYAMPQWWLDSSNNFPNKCLEHGKESMVQSIWNPVVLQFVHTFMKAFAEHYSEDIIDHVMLGPAGDFGETTTNGVFTGDYYHTHVGHWCGEDIAVADLRGVMRERYGDIGNLNFEWRTGYRGFDEIKPFLREDAPSDRAWLDVIKWYVERMNWWTEEWGKITRSALKKTVIFMAAGGAGDPPRASTWSGQMKALVDTGVGARVTNEGGDFAFNFAYTSWAGTCCKFYGLPFGNEPWGGDVTGNGVLARIYNAVTQDAKNFWTYNGHIESAQPHLALERGFPFLDGTYKRKTRVAVYYPWTHFLMEDEHGFSEKGMRDIFWPQVEELRDIIDYDLVDSVLVADGIMKEYDFLIILQGTVYEHDELERIVEWVRQGGILMTHNIGLPTTVEGDISLGQHLISFDENPGHAELEMAARIGHPGDGCLVMYPRNANMKGWYGDDRWDRDHKDHPATHPGFWSMIQRVLGGASRLGTGVPDQPLFDGEKDEVYGAIVEHDGRHGVLYYSQAGVDHTKHIIVPGGRTVEVKVPAGGMVFAPYE